MTKFEKDKLDASRKKRTLAGLTSARMSMQGTQIMPDISRNHNLPENVFETLPEFQAFVDNNDEFVSDDADLLNIEEDEALYDGGEVDENNNDTHTDTDDD